ncbi:hypothetical protein A3E39_04155 [Candidatus Uhrbacteria bacterium RIFCSPHIGHO2_12_FULL_60_25]|uniref:CYTH domain-containing protein n=1 Tax=Candidatus Uhrbacteria bacterium RIFCSPHIGHO2_12_FULL_60_25 TaxID=1802399 RepID=A0A1F7UN42_9BACT|nr:MAG: hypothetical protein A3D73_02465 [Candidatus Uhrbacteria bacterium RIFCSPHIGHO2_02_FULL_60_44]OGL79128.1 MAG: hypothetical protein A3E39_04155 [Candidatus Uhrbacteria bacterium RIFCSPHIGHO2_12_FULL_60_25]
MELEIRANVRDLKKFTNKLNALVGVRSVELADREVDTYMKHGADTERILIIRIRRKARGAILTFKAKSQGRDISWHDIDIPLAEPDRLEDILIASGYVYVVLIDKLRDAFRYKEYEINLDQIRELGTFVEIAFETPDSIDSTTAEKKTMEMKQILRNLGCIDADIIEVGYVKLMERHIAGGK